MARVVNKVWPTYVHGDHLGSPVTRTQTNGTILPPREEYSPFGITLNNAPDLNNQAGFTGHIKDAATGLNYMQARYYDPIIGRFLSVDPVDFLQTGDPRMFNRYAYVFNDPINGIDPDGKMCATCPPIFTAELMNGDIEGHIEVQQGWSKGSSTAIGLLAGGPVAGSGKKVAGGAIGGFFLKRAANRSFAGANKLISRTIGQASKTGGKSGKNTPQVFSGGGEKSANKLFGTLTKGRQTKTNPNGSFQGTLKDGSSVNMSTNSKGFTSVRIKQSTPDTGTRIRKEIKVRFKEDQ